MNTRIRKATVFNQSPLYVNQKGELMATPDFKRFFPIDGLVVYAFDNDTTEIDTIKPYQFIKDGKCDYYPIISEKTNTVMRLETENNYNSMDDSEDVDDIKIEKGNGCTAFIALVGVAFFIILFGLIKLFSK